MKQQEKDQGATYLIKKKKELQKKERVTCRKNDICIENRDENDVRYTKPFNTQVKVNRVL